MPKVDQNALLQGFRGMMSTPESIAAEQATKANAEAASGSDFDTMEQYLSNRKKLVEPSYDDPALKNPPRDAERDKWLALTEFGSRLASGSSPYFAQNFGPAAAAGIASYRQSQAQYDDDMMKRTNARLIQTQLNETARSRTDNTAAKLVEIAQQGNFGSGFDHLFTDQPANDQSLAVFNHDFGFRHGCIDRGGRHTRIGHLTDLWLHFQPNPVVHIDRGGDINNEADVDKSNGFRRNPRARHGRRFKGNL
jgi:hypothetical protein